MLMLTLLAFAGRLAWFTTTPHPLGTDGYYYVVQTTSLVDSGRLHVADASWVFVLHGLFGTLLAPVLTTKVVAAALAAIVVPAAWLVGGRTPTGVALALWAAASPTLTHLAADFPKNLGVAGPWFLLVAATRLVGWRRWVALGLAVPFLLTAHRTGLVLTAGFVLAAALASTRLRGPFLVIGLLGVLALVCVGPFVPGLPVLADRFRLDGQLGFTGLSPLPWFALRVFHPVQQLELLSVWPAVFVGVRQVWKGTALSHVAPCLAVLVGLLLPVFATDTLDLGYRLCLLTPLAAAPILATVVRTRFAWLGIVLLPAMLGGVDPERLPPYDRYDSLIDALPRPLPNLLIAHQGINFLYDHRTGHEAMAWAPEPSLDPTTIGRLVWGVRDREWVALDVPRVRLSGRYSYATEDDWHQLRTRAALDGDDDLRARLDDWRNPTRIRPWALTRGKDPTRTRP